MASILAARPRDAACCSPFRSHQHLIKAPKTLLSKDVNDVNSWKFYTSDVLKVSEKSFFFFFPFKQIYVSLLFNLQGEHFTQAFRTATFSARSPLHMQKVIWKAHEHSNIHSKMNTWFIPYNFMQNMHFHNNGDQLIESFEHERAIKGHLVQPPCNEQGHL